MLHSALPIPHPCLDDAASVILACIERVPLMWIVQPAPPAVPDHWSPSPGHPPVFNQTIVAVLRAVLLSRGAAQRHNGIRLCTKKDSWEEGRCSLQPVLPGLAESHASMSRQRPASQRELNQWSNPPSRGRGCRNPKRPALSRVCQVKKRFAGLSCRASPWF